MSIAWTPVNGTVICFGASFDPPHAAHAALAVLAARAVPGAEVWLLPSLPRWDKAPRAPWDVRHAWCQTLAAELAPLGVPARASRVEADAFTAQGAFRGTTLLFERLRACSPRTRWMFLCGEDALRALPSWRDASTGTLNGLDLLCHHTILVAPRPATGPSGAKGTPGPPVPWEAHPAVVRLPPIASVTSLFPWLAPGVLEGLSSTEVRRLLAGGSVDRFAPQATEHHVRASFRYL